MNITSDPNLWAICGLVFLLGLLVGAFLTAGGRRKWKTRYDTEIERRRELEKEHEARERHWAEQEREWREQDALRAAALKDAERNRPVAPAAAADPRDVNRDGYVSETERKPGLKDRVLGRDRDGDGIPDDRDPVDNRRI